MKRTLILSYSMHRTVDIILIDRFTKAHIIARAMIASHWRTNFHAKDLDRSHSSGGIYIGMDIH